MTARCALILTYNLVSGMALSDGTISLYRNNTSHPLGQQLWVSPALFSDAAAALVLRRTPEVTGFSFYSRDSHSFGDEPGFTDPIIHYPGGGVAHPPGTQDAAELSCYGIVPTAVKEYYTKGMMLNHDELTKQRPGYVEEVRRIYTHQASPALVDAFAKMAALRPDKAPRMLGGWATWLARALPRCCTTICSKASFGLEMRFVCPWSAQGRSVVRLSCRSRRRLRDCHVVTGGA